MEYILNEKRKDCVFCTALESSHDSENLVVARGRLNFVILNRYPYSSGHLMVVPMAHIGALEELDAETRGEMMELASHALHVLREEYRPHGFNLGINEGSAAGAGIHEHLHLHVVPRWNGDTNFMSSLAGTRVLPEPLEDTLQRLARRWNL